MKKLVSWGNYDKLNLRAANNKFMQTDLVKPNEALLVIQVYVHKYPNRLGR